MIAADAFLTDELIEIAIGTVISQLPAAMLYVVQDFKGVKERLEDLISRMGAMI